MTTYDSRPDTYAHIAEVRRLMLLATGNLTHRAHVHDLSKLAFPEVEVFDRVTPRLKEVTYGSDEYKASLADMGEGLKHHYEHNDHHPEHHRNGIKDMDLLQLLEMVCDWMAASKRHPDGDVVRSINQNAERFGYGPDLTRLLVQTVFSIRDLEKRADDAALLAEFRTAERDFNDWKVQDANDCAGGPPSPEYLAAEKRYWAAHEALLKR